MMYARRALVQGTVALAAAGVLGACQSGPQVAGKWELVGSRDAGLEIKGDGSFQGELPPNVKLQGKWEANGSDVTFTLVDGPAARLLGKLTGKIDGDTMTLLAAGPPGAPPSSALTLKR